MFKYLGVINKIIIMKRILFLVIAVMLLVSCGDNMNDKAGELLARAREAAEMGRYNEARVLIDSIRTVYPEAIEARRSALGFADSLELTIAKQELSNADSMFCLEMARFDSMKQYFTLEKDPEFQSVGNYVTPEQISAKMHKTALRAQVNEEGLMVIISIVHGKRLNHKSIRVTIPTGDSVETPQCFSFLTHNVVGYEEEASYKLGEDGGVVKFIANETGPMTITCMGETDSLTFQLSASDKHAVRSCYDLARQFESVNQLREQREKLSLKVRFYEKKLSL